MRLVALAPGGEDHREGTLVALGLDDLMGRKLAAHGLELIAELDLDEQARRVEPFLHGLGDHGANRGVGGKALGVLAHELRVGGQVEVQVVDGHELGGLARERALGGDELLGLELVAQIAFVGVGLLGLAALDGAAAEHLAAVQELAGGRVKELLGGELGELALLVEALDDLGGHALMDVHGGLQGAAGVQVAGHAEARQVGLLAVVVLADVIGDVLVVAIRLAALAEALHDGGAVAVRARDEDHVLAAQAVAQEAGVEVRRHEHAADVAKVQALVAVGHACGDNGAAGPRGAVGAGELCCHSYPSFGCDPSR